MKRLSVVGAQTCCARLAGRDKIAPLPIRLTSNFRILVSFFWLLAFGLMPHASCLAAPAAPQDLGRGLTYARLQQLPDDDALLATVWKAPALIIDLRHPVGATGQSIPADLPSRSRTAPLFILVGPDTPAGLLAALRDHAPALITIGLAAPGLTPDIALPLSPEADRRAYDALAAGASAESLISESLAKRRFDEAALARERDSGAAEEEAPGLNGTDQNTALPAARPPTAAAAPAPVEIKSAPPVEPKPPVIDAVLQRAVQLHRALLALGKLPHG
jgi:hypothetical protein